MLCARSRSIRRHQGGVGLLLKRKESRLHDFFLAPNDGIGRIDKDFREFFDRLRVLRRERDGGMEPLLMAMATGYDYRKYQKVKANERRQA